MRLTKKITLSIIGILVTSVCISQDPSAILDLESSDQGILIPRTDTASVNNAFTPATALIIYQTSDNTFYFYNGSKWMPIGVSGGDNLGDHKATENIHLQDAYLSNDGDNEGIQITDEGGVSVGKAATAERFEVFADSLFTNEILDQSVIATGMPLTISNSISGAQTFVADTSGTLTRIEILAKNNNALVDTLLATIKTGTNPASGTILATAEIVISSSTDSIYNIIFEPGVAVNKNDSLLIILSQVNGDDMQWQRSSSSVYANGDAWVDASGWLKISDKDHGFKSYIETPDSIEISALQVNNNLNVGIGIADPTERLQINGALRISSNSDSNPQAGTIRWNEDINDFEGFTGSVWKSLTSRKDDKFWGNTDLSYNSTECSKITASDPDTTDYFGHSVSVSGDYIIVGADLKDGTHTASGAAYIFNRAGNAWNEEAMLTASDANQLDFFGRSVSLSGSFAIIGATSDDSGVDSGSAYIFMKSGSSWSEQAKITASDADAYDNFGSSVAISGEYAIIGAPENDDNGSDSGAAYIFKRSGSSWIQQAKLIASDASTTDHFGTSVAISGEYAVISAPLNDDDGSDSGSVYIFKRSGTSWTEQAKLTASDASTTDKFGSSVSISGDYIIIGASQNDDDGTDSGSAYVFHRSGASWMEQAKLTASDAAAGDRFGNSVSISQNYILIGAFQNDDGGTSSGSAYVFTRSGESWMEQAKLTASDADSTDFFGFSVSISGDYAIIGAYGNDDNSADSGSVYIFD